MGEPRPEQLRNSSGRVRHNGARSALLLAVLLALPGVAQYPPHPRGPAQQSSGDAMGSLVEESSPVDLSERQKRVREMNAARQKAIVADTEKLLKLARELKDEIGSTNLDQLVSAEVSKLAEIEKLAHSIKEKMSFPVQLAPEPWTGRPAQF